MSSDVVVEDWLWDDDSPEEPEELELSYEERLLRKRAMWMFVWTLVGMVALAVLAVVSYRIINEEPTKTLPAACVEGRIEQCPTKGGGTGGGGAGAGGGSRSTLPGGFDPATGDSKNDGGGDGLTKQQAEARIRKCIQGQVEFCG